MAKQKAPESAVTKSTTSKAPKTPKSGDKTPSMARTR